MSQDPSAPFDPLRRWAVRVPIPPSAVCQRRFFRFLLTNTPPGGIIIPQVMAAEAMLNRVNQEILTAHLKHCVNTAHTQEEREKKIDELVDMLGKILK